MKTQTLLALCASIAFALQSAAITLTNDTSIGVSDDAFDGQEIVVSNCTLRVDGPHTFAGLLVAPGGTLTHSYSPSGVLNYIFSVANEPQTLIGTNAVTLLNTNIFSEVSVTDTNSTTTYTNGVDYVITSFSGVYELQRTETSAIPDGDTVFVSYSWQQLEGPAGLNLSVTGNAEVATGGAIIADGIGYGFPYGAGRGNNAFGSSFDSSGGGYGGYGGTSSSNAIGGACYGSLFQPQDLGSPGGLSFAGPGGNGGGAIRINCSGDFIIDGVISANGANGIHNRSGGGSGGSIWITATNVSGSGAITANGGNGEPIHGGGGGGGRIAIQCETNDFTGSMTAYGGNGWQAGGAGTIYIQLAGLNGLLLVDNGGRAGTNSLIALINNPNVVISGNAGVMASGSWVVQNLTIGTNSSLRTLPLAKLNLTVQSNLVVASGGSVSADLSGNFPMGGSGAGHGYGVANLYPCSGAGYGGYGGLGFPTNALPGFSYGSQFQPTDFGSGGGSLASSIGGAGGGAIQISVNRELRLDGRISANGGNGSGGGGGGGSGGAIALTAQSLTGAGFISANGGDGVASVGGGGGGGRIAITINNYTNAFAGNLTAYGGSGAQTGGAGTVFVNVGGINRQLIVDNADNLGAVTPVQALSDPNLNLIFQRGGIVTITSYGSPKSLFIGSNAWIRAASSPYMAPNLNITGDATIEAGGGITADLAGYPAGQGSGYGAGKYSTFPPYACSGGGHGGSGGNSISNYCIGGSSGYDYSVSSPLYAGSGGGAFQQYSLGGPGGGGIQLTVNGALKLDGVLSANGGDGSGIGGGGGAGGTIRLNVGGLSGSGAIRANGGNGADSIGGGGGGGMISISIRTNLFAGVISATGGAGANWGGAGIIYDGSIRTNSQLPLIVLDNNGHSGAISTIQFSYADWMFRNGAIAIANNQSSIGDLTIGANSWLVVSNAQVPGSLNLSARNVDIQAGGGISADSFGYAANNGPGRGTYFSGGPLYPGSGAGHGGYGGYSVSNSAGGTVYDTITNPTMAGSGGGGALQPTTGGAGGGVIQLNLSGTLRVDGTLSANGGNGAAPGGGGGSGGSINLHISALSGSGTISADGGNGADSIGGGGGGGMIRISFNKTGNSNSFAGTLSAHGGGGANCGGAGTILLQTTTSEQIIVDNGGNHGTNTLVNASLISRSLTVSGGATAVLPSSSQIFSSLLIRSNAWIAPSSGSYPASLNLTINNAAIIEAGGGILADAMGYPANSGNGRGFFVSNPPFSPCSGAGHGGYGGLSSGVSYSAGAAGGNAYDSTTAPFSGFGGSGGGGFLPYSIGGSGGAYINLRVYGSLLLDGVISANGGDGSGSGGGGGSGGSVVLNLGTFSGSGAVTANGGAGASNFGGGGGGGRIVISLNTNSFGGLVSAYGGGGANWGGAGTVYLKTNSQPYGQLVLDNGGHAGTNTTFDASPTMDVTIQNRAIGMIPSLTWNVRNLLIRSNSALTATPSTGKRSINTSGTLEIQSGGALTLNGMGNLPAFGSGAGHYSSGIRGGGGHGGYGGGNIAGGGDVYDLIQNPSIAGSGGANYGGNSPYSYGGSGGGALQLFVDSVAAPRIGDVLTVDGTLSVNGLPGDLNSGGGSGGSLYISALKIAGTGIISANGGAGYGAAGGGGGGRIAISCTSNAFSGQITASGGDGMIPGGAGTIYFTKSPGQLFIDNGGLFGTNTPLSSVFLPPNSKFDLTIANGAQVTPLTPLPVVSNLNINAGGTLTMISRTNLLLAALGDVTVAANGAINMDALGFGQSAGPGAGASLWNQGAGGGYGGIGGASGSGAAGGTNYGSAAQPMDLGSGGGAGYGPTTGGSIGGGAVRITVAKTLNVDGNITANGTPAWQDDAGGGSGGSVWITAGAITGLGAITADGGDGDFYGGGGGGGGRIAIYSPSNSWNGFMTTDGGDGANPGMAGTIFLSTNLLDFQITSQTPAGIVSNFVSTVDLNFNDALARYDTSASNIVLLTPDGPVSGPALSASLIGAYAARIDLPQLTVPGDYQIQISGGFTNLFGQPISQVYTGAFTIELPIISGTVTDTNGQGVAGVVLHSIGLPDSTTDTNGDYAIAAPSGWSGTVTPSSGEFVFVPGSLSYSNVTASVPGQNYLMIATIAPTLDSSVNETNLLLNWTGISGVSYQIQWSTNLMDWQPLGDAVNGTNGAMQFILPMTNQPAGFFRVEASD